MYNLAVVVRQFSFFGSAALLVTLVACGGSGGSQVVDGVLYETSFSSAGGYIVALGPTSILKLDPNVYFPSQKKYLQEVSLINGTVLRQVVVDSQANTILLSKDRSQAYVYTIRGSAGNPNTVQRVNVFSFSVAATYAVPTPSGTTIEDVDVNPENALEVCVLARVPASSSVALGPAVYRNDVLLPNSPNSTSHFSEFTAYDSGNTILGRRTSSSPALYRFNVDPLGTTLTTVSSDPDPFDGRRFSFSANKLFGNNGSVVDSSTLTLIRSILPSMSASSFTALPSPDGSVLWFFVRGDDGRQYVEVKDTSTNSLISSKEIIASSTEDIQAASVESNTHATIQTHLRTIDLRLN